MPLTNQQYNAIIRQYDLIRIKNKHIHDDRLEDVRTKAPEYDELDKKISELSVEVSKQILTPGITEEKKKEIKKELDENLRDIENAKKEILIRLYNDPHYLDPIYTCSKCKDTGYVDNITEYSMKSQCDCFKKKAIDLIYGDSNLKNITINENFNTFDLSLYPDAPSDELSGVSPREYMRNLVEETKSFVRNFDKKHGNFLFYGQAGVGKTFLSNCIASELINSVHSVIYFTATDLFDSLRKDISRNGYYDDSADDELGREDITYCDLLIIDDLGTEYPNQFTINKFFNIVNDRLLNNKSTIISTNLSLKELRDIYTERTFSRLANLYNIRKIVGNDLRYALRNKRL